MGIIILILVVWLILAVLGFAVKSLLWLGIIAAVLFLATIVFGFVRGLFSRK